LNSSGRGLCLSSGIQSALRDCDACRKYIAIGYGSRRVNGNKDSCGALELAGLPIGRAIGVITTIDKDGNGTLWGVDLAGRVSDIVAVIWVSVSSC
jgi:hypothetical protein